MAVVTLSKRADAQKMGGGEMERRKTEIAIGIALKVT